MSAGTATLAPAQRDYRDLVIADLANSEAILLDRIASLEANVAIRRELSQQAIHALHDVTKQRDQARQRLYALLDARREQSQQRAP